MKLIEIKTGKKLEGEIVGMRNIELKKFKKHKNFIFDWSIESKNDIYKILLKDGDEILGIVSAIDIPEELRMHLNLLESSKKLRGKNKPIQNIVGCLIGFVCQLSFKRGYEGFVSLLVPRNRSVTLVISNLIFRFIFQDV